MDYSRLSPNRVYSCVLMAITMLSLSAIQAQSKSKIQHIQSKYNKSALAKVQDEFSRDFTKKDITLRAFAKNNGLKISETLNDGNQIELVDIGADGTPLYYSTFSDNSSMVSRANTLYTGGALDLGISGQGMKVGVWDAGKALLTHQEYSSRAIEGDNTSEINAHATMVLGSMIAKGIKSQAKGVAYNATAISSDWKADKVEVITAAANGLLLSNHSYGIRPDFVPDWYFGAYIQVAKDWDRIMYNAPYYLMVTAAGNSQKLKFNDAPIYGKTTDGFDLLLGFSTTKNGINVAAVESEIDNNGNLVNAAVASYSSHGPTDDGRIKPDIAGCGANILSTQSSGEKNYDTYSGTSMAAPGITSAMLLLQEYYDRLNGDFMKASTLKGLVLHSADDVAAPGPDYKMGWGVMNTKKAAELIVNNEYSSLIIEESLAQGETYSITVDARVGEEFLASVSWTDPVGDFVNKGELNSMTPALVNDLDIRVTKNNVVSLPWKLDPRNANAAAVKGDNLVDPFEKIQLDNATGTYTITISHKGKLTNENQVFSLIVSGASTSKCNAISPSEFTMSSTYSDAIDISWEAIADSFFEVQYKKENDIEWNTKFSETNDVSLENLVNGGTYIVKLRTNCTTNIFSEYTEAFKFTFDGVLTDDPFKAEAQEVVVISDKLKFSVHPNPTTDQITIDGPLSDNAYYSIVSSTGTLLKKGKAKYNDIQVDDLSSGFYSLTIFEDGEQQSMKFIKN
ncbi:S8 family serine peptidase [Cellulophaga sp. Z1A5H]|uniref:S8 family serine peptidase n=1 Tax=Cellulophaga sp. Z1A5H TaxID=2687291 RepID=UPI0013FD8D5C|nr:S8 family serine peptidase [Cellulophaga sp. Z1A5H]